MDFHTMLATLATLTLTILGRRYTGYTAVCAADSPRTGAYLASLLTDGLRSAGVDLTVFSHHCEVRNRCTVAVAKAATARLDAWLVTLDSTADGPRYDALSAVLAWCEEATGEVHRAIGEIRGDIGSVPGRWAYPGWADDHAARLNAVGVTLARAQQAMNRLDSMLDAPATEAPAPPVQLTLDLTPPARTAPRPTTGTEQEPDWTRDAFPPKPRPAAPPAPPAKCTRKCANEDWGCDCHYDLDCYSPV